MAEKQNKNLVKKTKKSNIIPKNNSVKKGKIIPKIIAPKPFSIKIKRDPKIDQIAIYKTICDLKTDLIIDHKTKKMVDDLKMYINLLKNGDISLIMFL